MGKRVSRLNQPPGRRDQCTGPGERSHEPFTRYRRPHHPPEDRGRIAGRSDRRDPGRRHRPRHRHRRAPPSSRPTARCSRPASPPPSPRATETPFSKYACSGSDLRKPPPSALWALAFFRRAAARCGLRASRICGGVTCKQLGVDHRTGRLAGRRAAERLERDAEGRIVDDRRIVGGQRRPHA